MKNETAEQRLSPGVTVAVWAILTAALAIATVLTWPAAADPVSRIRDAFRAQAEPEASGPAVAETRQ